MKSRHLVPGLVAALALGAMGGPATVGRSPAPSVSVPSYITDPLVRYRGPREKNQRQRRKARRRAGRR
jgi:hypothetical protein